MVDYAQLAKLDTSKLTSASQASGGFATAMSNNGEAVRTKSEIPAEMWAGADANAAGGLLGLMSEPLYDLSDSANSGKKTLDDLVTGLGKAKEHLQGAHDAIKGTGITIGADGTVTTPVVNDPQLAADNDRKAQDARDIIVEAVKTANEADTTATEQLGSLASAASASYMEIPGKREQLDQAVNLLNTPKNEITPQKAKELNDLLAQNNNPEFNRQLMERLGPQGLLEKSANFSETGAKLAENGDTAGADAFKQTQQRLGESLASASQNGGLTPEWTQELMDQGAQRLPNSSNIGYEALAPLLEHGKYDPSFLVPVAEHITRLDHGSGLGNESSAPGASVSGIDGNPYNIDGKQGYDSAVSNPLNSVMTALDNSPEAATDYFTGTNEEHGQSFNGADGKPLKPTGDAADNPNIDYALDRAAGTEPGDLLDVNRVGNALEAATTGVSSDAPDDAPVPERSADRSNIAEHLVHRFGDPAGSGDIMPGGKLEDMADNMTDVATHYMPEIHNSFLSPLNEDAYLLDAPMEALAGFDNESDVHNLLNALGRDDAQFNQLMGANHEIQDRMLAQEYLQNATPEAMEKALLSGDTTSNILLDAQAEAGVQEAADTDKEQNDRTDAYASGAKIAASAIPIGPLGATAGEVIDQIKQDAQVDTTQGAWYDESVHRTDLQNAQMDRQAALIEQLIRHDGVTPEEAALLDQDSSDGVTNGVSDSVDDAMGDAWVKSQLLESDLTEDARKPEPPK